MSEADKARQQQKSKTLLSRAEASLYAVEHFSDMISEEKDLKKLSVAWAGLLDNYTKTFKFLREATSTGKSKSWSDRLKSEQRNDTILEYLLHARNADGHGLDFIAEATSSQLWLGGGAIVLGEGVIGAKIDVTVRRDGKKEHVKGTATVKDGSYSGSFLPGMGRVDWKPRHLRLRSVKDRGQIYDAPSHLAKDADLARVMGAYAAEWLRKKLEEAIDIVEI